MPQKLPLLALAALTLGAAHAQTSPAVRSMLLDFGPNDGTNGNSTSSPDANGNYWNNILNNTGVADTFRLVDKQNAATGVKVKVGANFLTNGIQTGVAHQEAQQEVSRLSACLLLHNNYA